MLDISIWANSLIIPKEQLSPEALRGVLEAFVLRGADQFDGSMDDACERLMQRLNKGELVIVFSVEEGEVSILERDDPTLAEL